MMLLGRYDAEEMEMTEPVQEQHKLEHIEIHCKECGKSIIFDDPEFIAAHKRLKQNAPQLAEKINSLGYYCEDCFDYKMKQSTEAERKRERKSKLLTLIAKGWLPEGFSQYSFDHSKKEVEEKNLAAWNDARNCTLKKCVWIHGLNGTGRTYLARCLGNKALDIGYTVRELNGVSLVNIFRKAQYKPDTSESAITALERVGILIIDDIHTFFSVQAYLAMLWSLMDVRSTSHKCTIVTSVYSPFEQIRKWVNKEHTQDYSNAIIERMKPMDIFTLRGESIREY